MVQTSSQSTVNKIEMRLRGKRRGSIVYHNYIIVISQVRDSLAQLDEIL